jgi:hypothetical protein
MLDKIQSKNDKVFKPDFSTIQRFIVLIKPFIR